MSELEAIIKSLVGLGQSIPKEKRNEIFGMLRAWLDVKATNCDIDTASYFNEQNPDIQKAIHLIKKSIDNIDHWTAMTLLQYAPLFINVTENALQEQRQHEDHIQYVTTQPDYLREIKHAAATAPIWGGTLFDAIRELIKNTNSTIDIINPYWSVDIIDALFKGFDKPNINIRMLTLLSGGTNSKNYPAVEKFKKIVSKSGSTTEIYSPTDEQISQTNAIAVVHAKLILSDKMKVYVGSANLSKGGLDAGLEIGVIHTGPTVKKLVEYCDWIFSHSTQV